MIVNRRTFVVKRGCMLEAVATMKELRERGNGTFRIYTPNIAPFDIVVVEFEYGSLEEYDKEMTDWFASPEADEFLERWFEITKSAVPTRFGTWRHRAREREIRYGWVSRAPGDALRDSGPVLGRKPARRHDARVRERPPVVAGGFGMGGRKRKPE
jgi:hypothetical protein